MDGDDNIMTEPTIAAPFDTDQSKTSKTYESPTDTDGDEEQHTAWLLAQIRDGFTISNGNAPSRQKGKNFNSKHAPKLQSIDGLTVQGPPPSIKDALEDHLEAMTKLLDTVPRPPSPLRVKSTKYNTTFYQGTDDEDSSTREPTPCPAEPYCAHQGTGDLICEEPDKPWIHASPAAAATSTLTKEGLTFSLIDDKGNTIAQRTYDIPPPPPPTREKLDEFYKDLEEQRKQLEQEQQEATKRQREEEDESSIPPWKAGKPTTWQMLQTARTTIDMLEKQNAELMSVSDEQEADLQDLHDRMQNIVLAYGDVHWMHIHPEGTPEEKTTTLNKLAQLIEAEAENCQIGRPTEDNPEYQDMEGWNKSIMAKIQESWESYTKELRTSTTREPKANGGAGAAPPEDKEEPAGRPTTPTGIVADIFPTTPEWHADLEELASETQMAAWIATKEANGS